MKELRLANEYLAGPIFCVDLSDMGHVDVDDLPLSASLKQEIIEWDRQFQETYCDSYPPSSAFASLATKKRHDAKGIELAKKMERELEGAYVVSYSP